MRCLASLGYAAAIGGLLLGTINCSDAGSGGGPAQPSRFGSGASSSTGGSGNAGASGGSATGGSATAGSGQGGTSGASQGGSGPGAGGAPGVGGGGPGQGGTGGAVFGFGGSGAGPGQGGSGGFQGCESVSETATNELAPSDILILVDTSGSMSEETDFVRSAMSIFATGLPSKNIDYHVVFLSTPNEPCIQAPMGSGSCPNDSKPPTFVHLPITVNSSDSLQLIIANFDQIEANFRKNSTKHVLIVSDDDSAMSAADFDQQFRDKLVAAGHVGQYTLHAVFAPTDPDPFFGCNMPPATRDPCCGTNVFGIWMPYTADVGEVYRQLAQMTGGQQGNLCLQEQGFVSSFTAVSQQVVASSKLACEWEIPPPPDGATFDPGKVNVKFTAPGSAPQEFGYVASAADCGGVADGWYYDDNNNPTRILVCPQTCQRLQQSPDGTMDIEFGCARRVAEPK